MTRPASDLPPALRAAVAAAASDARLVYVFGSVGTAYERPDSDLDVAVMYDGRLGFDERTELVARLEESTGRRVDLVDLATADPIIRRQVIATGTLIRAADSGTRATFEMATLSEYLDLKIDRRAAEQALLDSAR